MEKLKSILNKVSMYLSKYIFLVCPLFVISLFLIYAKINNLAPIGEKTISWCDMEQQVIPLLNMFKDMLKGKGGLTYNLANAGGMSMFGVFFFFLSSPFSLLVLFVSKSNMPLFMNTLVMLKMATASLTMGFYLKKKYQNLNVFFIIALAIFYAFSGYIVMYYQNVIWLDIVYLFPLLLLSCDLLLEKQKIIPYIIFTTLTVCVNYYLGIITIFFIILYMGGNFLVRRKEENIKTSAFKFIVSSLISALIAMVVLIPSFVDYFKSGRTISLIESLEDSWVLTSYVTTIPLILGGLVMVPLFFEKKNDNIKKLKLILLLLLTIPLIIDPINKMWHFGSYQAFPCRFGFINTFLILDIAALSLNDKEEYNFNLKEIIKKSIGVIVTIISLVFAFIFETKYVNKKIADLDNYPSTLWGNQTSFEALLRYYAIILIIVGLIYALYKFKLLNKRLLGVTYVGLAILEATFSFRLYVVSPSRDISSYQNYYELADIIDDDSFYRVKTKEKYRNVNDLGALGYNNLSHYTSLTPETSMNALKKLGYSSYWMEVSSYGGSIFTDALMLNKYTINWGNNSSALYSTSTYNITENLVYPLGIVTSNNLSSEQSLNDKSRVDMQEHIYNSLFNDSLHTKYTYTSTNNLVVNEIENGFDFTTTGGSLVYDIDVVGKKTLYFEAFDKYTSDLVQSINETMTIRIDGRTVKSNYPDKSYNGSVLLGTYEDTTVRVTIAVSKSIKGSSFNVFGIDNTKFENSINNAKHADLVYKNNKFTGTYTSSQDDEYLFLPLMYNSGIKARVNGKKVTVNEVFDGFIAIKLNKGENNIKISFSQKGLGLGISVSIIGLVLLGAYIYFDKKKKNVKYQEIVNKVSYILCISLGVIMFIVIYILPVILNVKSQIGG